MTAMVVEKPTVIEATKAAPIAAPSQKLWIPSPRITINAKEERLKRQGVEEEEEEAERWKKNGEGEEVKEAEKESEAETEKEG